MKSYLRLGTEIILHKFFSKDLKPFNLTISITSKCNSKCKTCNIWQKKDNKDLETEEWAEILNSIGKIPFWITISGGEPFLRKDLILIMKTISTYNKPKILNIATNGILTDKISSDVEQILKFYKGKLILNLSLDGVGKKHDKIRGVEDNSKRMIDTFNRLKGLKKRYSNLGIGLHTVISKYNSRDIPEIFGYVQNLKPDSYITEIAENRKELGNINDDISPKVKDYFSIIDFLSKNQKYGSSINILRKGYYQLTKEVLTKQKEIIRCYAGRASVHISSEGKLWACCMHCEELGDIKKEDLNMILKNEKTKKVLNDIKRRKCFCTLANVYYSNMSYSPITCVSKIILSKYI